MKTLRFIFASLPLLLLPLLCPAQAWDLDGCVDYAMKHNPEVLHARVQYQVQQEVLGEASRARVPVMKLGAQETMHSGNALLMYSVDQVVTMSLTQLAATLEMPLLTGGSLPNTVKAEEYTLKAASESMAITEINTRIRVAAACLELLECRSREETAKRQVDMCKELLERVELLFKEGGRTEADVAEARSSLSTAEYRHAAARGRSVRSRIALVNLMGLDDDGTFELSEPEGAVEDSPVVPLAELMEGLSGQPSLRRAEFNEKSALFRAEAARGDALPQLSLFANYNNYVYFPFGVEQLPLGEQLGHNGWAAVGLKLSVPILDPARKRQIARASLAHADELIALDETRRELSGRLREAYWETVAAKERHVSAVGAEEAASEAYGYQQKMYEAGLCTIYELNQGLLRYFSASEERVRSKYEYLLRNKILQYYRDGSGK